MTDTTDSTDFPPRIMSLLRDVAVGPFEDGMGDPLQTDARAAIDWIAASPSRAPAQALPEPIDGRIACETCGGTGSDGEETYQGEFQPPECGRCTDCAVCRALAAHAPQAAEPVAQVVQISMPGLQNGQKAVVIRAINGWVPKINTKLYLAPHAPAAQPLTAAQIEEISLRYTSLTRSAIVLGIVRATEAAHGIAPSAQGEQG